MKLVGLGVVGGVLLASTSAFAVEVGTVAVSGSFGAGASTYEGNASGTSKGGSVTVLPSVDVMVGRGWSLGVTAPVIWQQSKSVANNGSENGFSATFVQPGVQVGYYIPVGDWAAIWPVARASYGWGWMHQENGDGTSADPKAQIIEASLTPQVLILPTKSFFLRFQPGALSYRHTKWEGQSQGSGLLGVSPGFFMGIGVML